MAVPHSNNYPPIVLSRRFSKEYKKASVQLQGLIEGTIHDLVRHVRSDRIRFRSNYDSLAQLPEVMEIDVSGGCRMLAWWSSDTLHLLDVGKHEIVPRYTRVKFFTDKLERSTPPATFWPEGPIHSLRFFTHDPCESYLEFASEQQPDWLYFLSDQQREIVDEVAFKIIEHIQQDEQHAPVFILGGPGTGKTSILLNLLKDFTDYGIRTKLALSESVSEYVQACIPGLTLSDFRLKNEAIYLWLEPDSSERQIILVDDPKDQRQIAEWVESAKRINAYSVIIVFDPCQLSSYNPKDKTSGITDADFEALCKSTGADVYTLDACYRQKENLGRAARKTMETIANSTPFLASQKIAAFKESHYCLTELANNLDFPNPHGYLKVCEHATAVDIDEETDRLLTMPLWRHWSPLLIVFDIDLVESDRNLVISPMERIRSTLSTIGDVEKIKGLEFQHAFVFVTRNLFNQLENRFEGSGQAAYNERRLIRIPFTRAKDSMTVFVFD